MKIDEVTRIFIKSHREDDVNQLALRAKKTAGIDLPFALTQIEGWQKARKKIPSWAAKADILYPPHLSMEQCSSELTALYKQSIVKNSEGPKGSFADLTGGFGIDCSFIAQLFKESHYVEHQELLCDLAHHNFTTLELSSIEVHQSEAQDFLLHTPHLDWIFMDPARRSIVGKKVAALEDCTPNVLELKELLLEKADNVMLKLSPMLDIKQAVMSLGHSVKEVHVVSVDNECKELLIILHGHTDETSIKISTINLNSNGETPQIFVSTPAEEAHPCDYAEHPLNYLYEPNASILKAGAFKSIASHYGLKKLHPNSHLYTNENLCDSFPGRIFQVQGCYSLNSKELKSLLKNIHQANLTVRNFPMSVAELRKKLKIGDGGDFYLFATTLFKEGKVILICTSVRNGLLL